MVGRYNMKRYIKSSNVDEEYRGYILRWYENSGVYQISKPRPYDDQEYYWAQADELDGEWKIVYKRCIVKRLEVDDWHDVIDELEIMNNDIKPKMVHW